MYVERKVFLLSIAAKQIALKCNGLKQKTCLIPEFLWVRSVGAASLGDSGSGRVFPRTVVSSETSTGKDPLQSCSGGSLQAGGRRLQFLAGLWPEATLSPLSLEIRVEQFTKWQLASQE